MTVARIATTVLAVLAALASAGTATAGTVSGKLDGGTPSGGAAVVRAIDLGSGRVGGAQRVGRSGAFSLQLPAGAYTLAATVVDRRAGTTSAALSAPVSLRNGQQRRLRVKARKA